MIAKIITDWPVEDVVLMDLETTDGDCVILSRRSARTLLDSVAKLQDNVYLATE